jgi:hypothetical protein
MGKIIISGGERRQVQMSKPVAFWYNRNFDFIWNPPSALIDNPPEGFERILCYHAHEVEFWSKKLRAQEILQHEMQEAKRKEVEDAIEKASIDELRQGLQNSNDSVNKEFMARALEKAQKRRDTRKPWTIEPAMACEKKEGVAS